MTKSDIIKLLNNPEIKSFLMDNGILHLSLFGSFAKGQQNRSSDIDLLYKRSYEKPLGIKIIKVYSYLKEILQTDIDFVNEDNINITLKDGILSSKISIF